MKKCQFCAEEILDEAIKCKHCGSMLNQPPPEKQTTKTPERVVVVNTKNPGIAFILSFFLPGVGQFYNGHILKGFAVAISFAVGCLLIFPGVIIWILGLIDAYTSAKKINEGLIKENYGEK